MRRYGRVLTLLALLGGAAVAQPPRASRDWESLAEKLVGQCANVQEGEMVIVRGFKRDMDLLESIVLEVRKRGAHPLLTVESEALARRILEEVPAKYDSQTPGFPLKLSEIADVHIFVGDQPVHLTKGLDPQRMAAIAKAFQPIMQTAIKRKVRFVNLGNGLYPTEETAKRYGLTVERLADIFWSGLNVDYTELGAIGTKIAQRLATAEAIHVASPNGTDVTFSVVGDTVRVADGILTREKRDRGDHMSWLPAGEVYVLAVPDSANGTIVFDDYSHEGTEVPRLTLNISDGKLVGMSADAGLDRLQRLYDASGEGKERFGVFDIGINPGVTIPEGSKLATYTPAGMVTLGIGNDTWAGGDNAVPFAIYGFIKQATVSVGDTTIVKSGSIEVR